MIAKLIAPFFSGITNRHLPPVVSLINSVIALMVISCLSACTSPEPYRTNLAGCDTTECPGSNLDQWCKDHSPSEKIQDCIEQHTTPEKNEKYTLHYVEFDDQGWLPQKNTAEQKSTGNASKQLDFLMSSLYEQARVAKNGVSVVIYVHGWHHNAQYNDKNVVSFRQLLSAAKEQETKKTGGGKDIVGIYVGWRGESVDLPLFKYLTFWDRKSTAIHVAEGSTRELFARIHEYQKRTNKAENKHFVRTLYIGHSFGAQVVYFSISDQLIASIAGTKDQIDEDKKRIALSRKLPGNFRLEDESKRFIEMERPADMVLLINPAFEAARFEPLHRALLRVTNCGEGGCEFQNYIPPLLVIVTSDADTATKDFFPIGRTINSIFERPFSSDEQSRAVTHTPGFMDDQYNYRYVTHRLNLQSKSNPGNVSDPACAISRTTSEFTKNNHYFDGTKWRDGKGDDEGWMRNFCGADKSSEGTTLMHNKGNDPNSPIWNVRAAEDIIGDHNDIAQDVFKSFVLQLYHDLVLFDQTR